MSVVKDFNIKKGDLQPYYYVQVKDAAAAVVDLTGATIKASMELVETGAVVFSLRTTGITVSDAANGKFQLAWQSGDTDSIGKYHIEFEITPQVGGKFTVPNCEHPAVVYVRDRIESSGTHVGYSDGVTVTIA